MPPKTRDRDQWTKLEVILRRVIREELHQTGHSRVPQPTSDYII